MDRLLLLPALGLAQDAPVRVADIPREFKGEFEYDGGDTPYTLLLKIDKAEEKGGIIRFFGSHLYTPGDYKMKVEGEIDPKKRVVRIREYEPSDADSIIDGGFEGALSEDLQSIRAVWVTRDIGKRGTLKLKATKSK